MRIKPLFVSQGQTQWTLENNSDTAIMIGN